MHTPVEGHGVALLDNALLHGALLNGLGGLLGRSLGISLTLT